MFSKKDSVFFLKLSSLFAESMHVYVWLILLQQLEQRSWHENLWSDA